MHTPCIAKELRALRFRGLVLSQHRGDGHVVVVAGVDGPEEVGCQLHVPEHPVGRRPALDQILLEFIVMDEFREVRVFPGLLVESVFKAYRFSIAAFGSGIPFFIHIGGAYAKV
ncbi:hypothetical protein DL770_009782 [Monosporascus sp. CRB-9-2]|nr:hypothetical protein DL770_009782 [Monosporascus sp. CRB-9-2]